ncbi:DUF6502 family protein [Woeseia oceani]|uniref:Uncharacterized protein n=1 Tax=Woeseia oceani TaxID=1548547 RepID=A0A193LG95_9GAMM|nr:DUF6502 family protein [Woeseia oceani]ANO51481.1 hypothetical protein BA177_09950 [Woeseia oceani]
MTDSVKTGLLAAYAKLLRPLVRILLRHGITYAELSEVVKTVFVEIAAQEFRVPGKKMSKARIAIVTGLTRKEVQRLSSIGAEGRFATKTNMSRIGRVLSGWHTDPDFTGPYGMPLELRYDSDNADDVTFVRLVQRFSGDMTPRAMLDELIRVGAVVETDQNWFKVIRREYVPNLLAPNFLERVGTGIHNFVHTIETNMQKEGPGKGRFERSVWRPGGIKKADLGIFNQFVRDRCQALLDDIDNWLSKLEAPDEGKGDEVVQTGVGIYHYVVHDENSGRQVSEILDERKRQD